MGKRDKEKGEREERNREDKQVLVIGDVNCSTGKTP